MKRGKNPASAIPHSSVFFEAAVLGNTTSAPTIPADGPASAAVSTFPVGANGVSQVAAEVPTRSGTGVYTLTLQHLLVNVIPLNIEVTSAGASPTAALWGIITSIVPATRVVTFKTFVPNGTATDMGTSDMAILSFKGYDTNKPG